jgi:hypothetical protein
MTDPFPGEGVYTGQSDVPGGTAKRKKRDGFSDCPPGLRCSVAYDPICLDDTNGDEDGLVVRRPLSRLKRSRNALAPSAVESRSGRSGKLSLESAGSTVAIGDQSG